MRNTQADTPLWIPRLVVLGLTWSWAFVAIEINAFVKSNQLKNYVKHKVPPATVVVINEDDIFRAGAVATSISALIAALSTLFILFHLHGPLSPTALRFQGVALALCAIWLFSVLVPYTYFYGKRSAKVYAAVGGVSLSPEIVKTVEQGLGLSSKYKDHFFLRLVAILPWFTLLFTVIASVMLFVAASRVNQAEESGDSDSITKASSPVETDIA